MTGNVCLFVFLLSDDLLLWEWAANRNRRLRSCGAPISLADTMFHLQSNPISESFAVIRLSPRKAMPATFSMNTNLGRISPMTSRNSNISDPLTPENDLRNPLTEKSWQGGPP